SPRRGEHNTVVAAVPKAFSFRTQRRREAARNKRAIGLGPTHREVMTAKIVLRSWRAGRHAIRAALPHVRAQDRVTQPAGAAMHEQGELLFGQAEALKLPSIENLIDGL